MLKFIKHNMETITGIEVYPVISFTIFFLFFLGLFLYVFRTNKQELKEKSQLPLDSNELP